MINDNAVRQAANEYVRHGWKVVPVLVKEKAPKVSQWQNLRLTEEQVPHFFPEPSNVGILLGEPSGGIVDIDVDSPEARRVVPIGLPPTDCIFGHGSAPKSHFIYEVNPILRTERFSDVDGTVLVEIRSTGAQTLFPPSTHPSGEIYSFNKGRVPAKVEAEDLYNRVRFLAVYALLARHWPKEGGRQNAALALAGALVRAKFPEADVNLFISRVALAAADEEVGQRASTAFFSARRIAENGHVQGWPTLATIMGSNVVDRVREWLGIPKDVAKQANVDWRPSLLKLGDLLTLVSPPRTQHLPWLQEKSSNMVYGSRGVGKTHFSVGLAVALATGQKFLKWDVSKPVGVFLVDGEMALDEFRNRVTNHLPEEPPASLYFLNSEVVYQRQHCDLVLTGQSAQEAITQILDDHPDIKVLILDNISCLFAGIRESKKEDWEPINAWLIRLRHRGIATILVHHAGKGGDQRGTSGREDSLDVVIQLNEPKGYQSEEGCHFELKFTKARSVKGDEVSDLDVRLTEDNGQLVWQCQPLEESNLERVRRLIEDGVKGTKDIAEELGISQGWVSRLKNKIKQECAA